MIAEESISKVLEKIDAKELITLTSDLVKINSVWDPAAGTSEQEVAEYVACWAERQGFSVQVDEVAPCRPNVIVSWTAAPGERTLSLIHI